MKLNESSVYILSVQQQGKSLFVILVDATELALSQILAADLACPLCTP